MKTKKRTEIIFETHEITRIRVVRRQQGKTFEAVEKIQNDSISIEKQVGFKTRLKERLRGFWKRSY